MMKSSRGREAYFLQQLKGERENKKKTVSLVAIPVVVCPETFAAETTMLRDRIASATAPVDARRTTTTPNNATQYRNHNEHSRCRSVARETTCAQGPQRTTRNNYTQTSQHQ